MLTTGSSVREVIGEVIVSVAVASLYDCVVESGTLMGCVLFACTGITKSVSVRVMVDVAEALLAVDVKVVMPTASPVFVSPVAGSIALGTDVALVKVLFHVKVLVLYACSTELVSSANTVSVIQTVGATVAVDSVPLCAESVASRTGSGPPRVKVAAGTSVENDLSS